MTVACALWHSEPHNSIIGGAERDRMVARQIAARGVTDPRVLDAMRQVPREAFVAEGLRGVRLRGQPAADRARADHLAALHRRADDRGRRGEARRAGAGDRRGLRLRRGRAQPDRRQGLHHRAPRHAWPRRRRSGWPGSAIAMSRCVMPTARSVGRRRRRSTPSSSPPAGRRFRRRLRRQLKIGGRLVIPGRLARTASSGWSRSCATARTNSTRRIWARSCSCRWSATHGWPEQAGERPRNSAATETRAPAVRARAPADLIRAAAEPLPELEDPAFGRLFDRFADARVVLLGEATHGTSEFYSRAGGDHPPADRATRLQHRGGRGRLAGRGGDRPLRAPQGAARGGGARLPPLPDLDVAQRRGRTISSTGCAPTTTRARTGAARRLLRARHLQHERLDRGR